MSDLSTTSMLVAFVDLTRFMAQSQRVEDAEMAEVLDGYYAHVARAVDAGGGRVVKFFGDGGLATFAEAAVDRGVAALLALKDDVDGYLDARGWDCRLTAKAHFGPVVAGPMGAPGAKRFDVVGRTVNTAATLPTSGVSLSVAAFRKLGPDMRRRFKKHTAAVTYIRGEDSHRLR